MEGKTPKGARRRAAILDAAAGLFQERGFRATSLDDIGAVAGVSGPAIYQYFRSKDELLAVLIEESVVRWRDTVDAVVSEAAEPDVALERLVDAAVAQQLDGGSLRAVYYQEFRSLDDSARRRLARIARVTTAEWVHVLCEVRPELTEEEARASVVLVDGLLRSAGALHTSLDKERLRTLMRQMALGGLLAIGERALA